MIRLALAHIQSISANWAHFLRPGPPWTSLPCLAVLVQRQATQACADCLSAARQWRQLSTAAAKPHLHLRPLTSAAAGSDEVYATAVKLRRDKVLEVEFSSGQRFTFPAEFLRVESPAAGNQDSKDARGQLKVVHGRRGVGIMAVEPVGNYAVRLSFDDLHSTGIYTWPYLHHLGTHELSRMRRYIQILRDRGLSRDPPRRRTPAAAAAAKTSSGRQQQQSATGSGPKMAAAVRAGSAAAEEEGLK